MGHVWLGAGLAVAIAAWHVRPALRRRAWKASDPIFTLPILSTWWMVTRSWLSAWTLGMSALLVLGLFALVWALQFRLRRPPLLSLGLRLTWPCSLAAVVLVGGLHPLLKRIGIGVPWYWLVWVGLSWTLSLVLAAAGPRLGRLRALFAAPSGPGAVCRVCRGAGRRQREKRLERVLATEIRLLYQWLWPLWWLAGAGAIYYARKIALLALSWIQALFPKWALPLAAIGLMAAAVFSGSLQGAEVGAGRPALFVFVALFAAGLLVLAWRRKEEPLREWVFYGFLIPGLLDQYYSQLRHTVVSMEASTALGTGGFVGLSIWLLWLAFDLTGRNVHRIVREEDPAKIQLVGGFLWLLLSMLWLSYVDNRLSPDPDFSLQGNVTYDMFVGLTILGLPMAIYDALVRARGEPRRGFPWLMVAVLGVIPVQDSRAWNTT